MLHAQYDTCGSGGFPEAGLQFRGAAAHTLAKEDIPDYLELASSWVRDLAVARHDPEQILHQDLRPEITAAAQSVRQGFVPLASTGLAETQRRIQANATPRLSLEVLFIRLAAAMRAEE